MHRPKISVIITVYNIEKYIGECIESVLKQSIKDIELICIDDASTDSSFKILEFYKNIDTRIKIIRFKNSKGPSSARNEGYRIAKGEYIYQIDGDDYIVDGALERMYTCAKENNLDILTFSANAFADSKEIETKIFSLLNLYIRTGTYSGVMNGMKIFADFIHYGDFCGNLCCNFLNKQFFEKNKLYLLDGLYASADSPFLMYLRAGRVMCIPDILYMRRFRENSIVTSKIRMIKFESILKQFLYEINLWKQNTFDDYIEGELERYFKKGWKHVLKTYNDVDDKKEELKLLSHDKIARFIYNCCIKSNNTYWSEQTDSIIEEIRKYKNIVIYGAREIAKEVRMILEKNRIYNFVFAVSDNNNEKILDDKKIYNIEELKNMAMEAIVLVAVSQRHHKVIKEKLMDIGFENILLIK